MPVIKGTIARLVADKGFGFIVRVDSNAEYFFHRSAVHGVNFEELHEGRRIG